MKKIMAISLMLVAVLASNCGSRKGNDSAGASKTSNTGTSEIVFREYEHNFGKVAEGEKLSYTFSFKNKGTGNLIISAATTTCGCTVPKYDTRPISPEDSGNLEVLFDTSGKNGMQTKTITVKSNATKPVVLLKITADVETTSK